MQGRTGWLARGMIVVGLVGVFGACSSVENTGTDTGYGAGQTAPATVNCTDFCQRLADCAAHLCNEDNNTTRYLGSIDALASQCESTCTDAQLASYISQTQWQCVFHDSCRMALGNSSCGTPN